LWRKLAATTAPGIRVIVIPNASHIVWRDDPEAFRNSLRQALLP
jgi:pimeloyl-ACP methyl ester carboxylesterase